MMFFWKQVIRRNILKILAALLLPYPLCLSAAKSDILADTEIQEATPTTLEAEANLFKSIGMSLAMSLAQCERNTDCNVGVSETELERLLAVLNDRINGLVLRLESGDSEIESALLKYATQRDTYLQYQQKLAELIQEDKIASDSEALDLSIFEDVNDENLGEEDLLNDDFDPSE